MYVVAANAATDDPDTVCNITVINNRYLAIVVQTQMSACITSAESSTSGRCCMHILCSVDLVDSSLHWKLMLRTLYDD